MNHLILISDGKSHTTSISTDSSSIEVSYRLTSSSFFICAKSLGLISVSSSNPNDIDLLLEDFYQAIKARVSNTLAL